MFKTLGCLLVLFIGSLSASASEYDYPELGESLAQAGFTTVGALGGALVGGAVGYQVESCSVGEQFCGLAGILLGSAVGYGLGAGTSSYYVGKYYDRNGHWWAASAGAFAGLALGGVAASYMPNNEVGAYTVAPLVLGTPIAGSILGYYASDKFLAVPNYNIDKHAAEVAFQFTF